MDDPSSGTNLYRLDNRKRIKTFPVKVTKRKRVRQVTFSEGTTMLVSGSDHGIVYVFDRRNGEVLDELEVDSGEWVQTVTVSDDPAQICVY